MGWKSLGVVLLGDAAYCPSLLAGQGAGFANGRSIPACKKRLVRQTVIMVQPSLRTSAMEAVRRGKAEGCRRVCWLGSLRGQRRRSVAKSDDARVKRTLAWRAPHRVLVRRPVRPRRINHSDSSAAAERSIGSNCGGSWGRDSPLRSRAKRAARGPTISKTMIAPRTTVEIVGAMPGKR